MTSLAIFAVATSAFLLLLIATTARDWLHDEHVNQQRLSQLQADGVLHCQPAMLSPLHTEDVNRAGTINGIGFGGTAPTVVARNYYLNDADQGAVLAAFATCARASGWSIANRALQDSLLGSKRFPEGWLATLTIAVVIHPLFANQPIVEVYLQTDGV